LDILFIIAVIAIVLVLKSVNKTSSFGASVRDLCKAGTSRVVNEKDVLKDCDRYELEFTRLLVTRNIGFDILERYPCPLSYFMCKLGNTQGV